jgi:hypothetical protein
LDYTDDTYDGTSAHSAGGQLAVRYTVDVPARAYVADILIAGDPKPFELRIYDADQVLIASIPAEPTATGWFRLAFDSVEVEGDFYASVFYTTGNAPVIGRDSSSPQGRSWVVDPDGTWAPWSQKAGEFGLPNGEFAIIVWVTTE